MHCVKPREKGRTGDSLRTIDVTFGSSLLWIIMPFGDLYLWMYFGDLQMLPCVAKLENSVDIQIFQTACANNGLPFPIYNI